MVINLHFSDELIIIFKFSGNDTDEIWFSQIISINRFCSSSFILSKSLIIKMLFSDSVLFNNLFNHSGILLFNIINSFLDIFADTIDVANGSKSSIFPFMYIGVE